MKHRNLFDEPDIEPDGCGCLTLILSALTGLALWTLLVVLIVR